MGKEREIEREAGKKREIERERGKERERERQRDRQRVEREQEIIPVHVKCELRLADIYYID